MWSCEEGNGICQKLRDHEWYGKGVLGTVPALYRAKCMSTLHRLTAGLITAANAGIRGVTKGFKKKKAKKSSVDLTWKDVHKLVGSFTGFCLPCF